MMAKTSDLEAQKKRHSIQVYFWNIVGAVEHINLPKLEDAVKKEFNCRSGLCRQSQGYECRAG